MEIQLIVCCIFLTAVFMRCLHLLSTLATTAAALPSWIPKHSSSTRFAWALSTHNSVDALVASPSGAEVYAGSQDGNIFAINAASGQLLWNQTQGPVKSLAIDAEGKSLYAGLEYGISGLDLTRPPWNFTAGAYVTSVVASSSGTVYVGSYNNNVYALRATDGHELWVFTAGGFVLSVAASSSGSTMYAGSADMNVYVLRASDGHQLWKFTAGGYVGSVAASSSGDTVYAAASDKKVYALRASDGHRLWIFPAGDLVISTAASPLGDVVYAGSGDKNVYALRASDGHPLWIFAACAPVTSVAASPLGDAVYATSPDCNHMYALRASDGELIGSTPGYAPSVAASTSGDTVYAVTGGLLCALPAAIMGPIWEPLWCFKSPGGFSGVASSPSSDMLYVVTNGHMVLATNSRLPNGMVQMTFHWASRSGVEAFVISGHLDRFYAACGDGTGEIYAMLQDRVWRSIRRGNYLDSLSINPEGATAYAGVDRGFCKLNIRNMQGQLWNLDPSFMSSVTSVAASPLGDTIYAASVPDSSVYALRASDGHRVWTFLTGSWVWVVAASPSGNTVYAGSNDKNVYALRASDGQLLWKFTAGASVRCVAASPSGDTVYAGSLDNIVHALRALDGQLLWNFTAGGAVMAPSPSGPTVGVNSVPSPSGPTVGVYSVASSPSGATVYAGNLDNNVYALRASDGQLLWKFTAGGGVNSVASSPLGATVYAGSLDQNVYALRASDGQLLWNFTAGLGVFSVASSPSGDTVYAGSADTNVYALRASDGHKSWSFTAGRRVWALAASPSGDTLYAGLESGYINVLSECLFYSKTRVTSTVVSPSGDVVYAGSVDQYVYAFNASGQNQLWNFSTQGGVTSVALSMLNTTVYASSHDHHIYALDASNGSKKWEYKVDSVVRRIAISLDGNFIYAGSDNGSVFALYANKEMKYEKVNWERIFMWGGTAAGGLAVLLGLGVPYICTQIHVVLFLFAGAAYGSALGMVTCYVMVKLPREVQAHSPMFVEDHDERRWLVQDPRCYGLSIVISGLVMAMLWGLCAHYQRLRSLTHLSSALVLVSTLLVAYNFVPGVWLAYWPNPGMYVGSRPEILVTWLLCSYCVGLVCLLLGLAMLDVLYKALERGRRTWRGHVYTRGLVLLPAFYWGFFGFWISTITAVLGFGQHGKFVPPYSPLSVLGIATGLLAFCIQVLSSPRDEHGWVRDRACELASYVTWWPWAREAMLRRQWQKRTTDIYPELSLRKIAQLCMNAWCPAWSGLRSRLSARTGLQLTSVQGCQPTLKDELTWSFLSFTATSMLAVMPLVVYWFYARFFMTPPQTMSLQRPYCISHQGLRGPFEQVDTLPVSTAGNADPAYSPLIFEGAGFFSDCRTRDKMEHAVDPGDFRLCMSETATTCLLYGCEWPKCKGVMDEIRSGASFHTWSNVELAVYAGFLLVCIWAIFQEADEKVHVWAALKLNRLFKHGGDWRDWHWWTRVVIVPGFLWLLAGVYAACLLLRHASQTYLIFSNPQDLQQWSRHTLSMLGPARGMYALSSALSAALVWYCDQGDFGNGPPSILKITYSDGDTLSLALAVVQGVYFFYQCYSLVAKQRKLYDFMDGDMFMETDSPQSNMECSYRYLHSIRDSGDEMSRADVARYLQRTVYAPFVREAFSRRPGLVQSLFNEEDVQRLLRDADRDESVSVVMGDEKKEADTSA